MTLSSFYSLLVITNKVIVNLFCSLLLTLNKSLRLEYNNTYFEKLKFLKTCFNEFFGTLFILFYFSEKSNFHNNISDIGPFIIVQRLAVV